MRRVAALLAAVVVAAAATIAIPKSAYYVLDFNSAEQNAHWKVSEVAKSDGGRYYDGEWAFEAPTGAVADPSDLGLVVKSEARHHGISYIFPKPVVAAEADEFVFQYEVRHQKRIVCGGSYAKLLEATPVLASETFSSASSYVVMFGPDRCGLFDGIHFILRYRNPVTGAYNEHKLTAPAKLQGKAKASTLYTLVLRRDNTFVVYADQLVAAKGSLLADLTPPIIPPETLDDPTDFKPSDWIDNAEMPDPRAVKPADWNEWQPPMVPDMVAVKPADWDESTPATINDPSFVKPAEWDDEEDGEWLAPQVPNPACEHKGCGPWERPLVKNALYRGKWQAPMIPNPFYKGPWKARQIPNPDYFPSADPFNLPPIGGVGFELWTMQSETLFDNLYFGSSLEDAFAYAEMTWKVTNDLDDALQAHQAELANKPFQRAWEEIMAFLTELPLHPIKAINDHPGVVVASFIVPSLLSIAALVICTVGSPEFTEPTPSQAGTTSSDSADSTAPEGETSATTGEKTEEEKKND